MCVRLILITKQNHGIKLSGIISFSFWFFPSEIVSWPTSLTICVWKLVCCKLIKTDKTILAACHRKVTKEVKESRLRDDFDYSETSPEMSQNRKGARQVRYNVHTDSFEASGKSLRAKERSGTTQISTLFYRNGTSIFFFYEIPLLMSQGMLSQRLANNMQ